MVVWGFEIGDRHLRFRRFCIKIIIKGIQKSEITECDTGGCGMWDIILPEDRREKVFRQIKERRGQSQFRDLLRQRYGNQCMITGLKLLDVLEAAHISPYRGTDDNHPDNGLLLRADLHTLFDLNLLGINPESLEVKFHPKVLKTSYQKLESRKLICSQYKPSQLALQYRWKEFLTRFDEDY